MRRRRYASVGSRVIPLALALTALLADGGGLHGLASWLVLLALPFAAAAAFVGISDALERRGSWLRGGTAAVSLLLLVLGSTVREHAALGAHVPTLAVTALVGAVLVYGVPGIAWVLEPLARPRTVTRLRTEP
jgi:hypothetical protein